MNIAASSFEYEFRELNLNAFVNFTILNFCKLEMRVCTLDTQTMNVVSTTLKLKHINIEFEYSIQFK